MSHMHFVRIYLLIIPSRMKTLHKCQPLFFHQPRVTVPSPGSQTMGAIHIARYTGGNESSKCSRDEGAAIEHCCT